MLFTVIASFSDHTNAVEQYEADSPDQAARFFIETAEAMADYDLSPWHAAAPNNIILIHIANELRGAWIWSAAETLESDDNALLGGVIVQTDPNGPRRPDAAV